jgi:GLPGLI family protein
MIYLFTAFLQAQINIAGNVEYTISYNTANKKDVPETEKNEQVIKIIKSARDITGSLVFSNNESFYKLDTPMESDADQGINLTRTFAGKGDVFYNDVSNDIHLLQKSNMVGKFLIIKKPIEWEITQELKKIGNYNCFKAIKKDTVNSNKKTIAWFTPQIPVSFGPKEFNGLPGLILELKHPKISYRATKIKLNPKRLIRIEKPTVGVSVTEEEYRKLLKDYFPGFFKKRKK